MAYRLLAEVVAGLHVAFLAYVVAGGFLAWRWPRAIVPHVLAAAWGFFVIAASVECPLTALQNALRRAGGQAALPGGFIDHYIEGVLYPARYTVLLRCLAIAVVLVSWLGAYRRHRTRRHRTRAGAPQLR